MTPEQVEGDIRQHVPVGSSRAKVDEYLDAHNIVHSYYGADPERIHECSNCEVALVRDTRSSGLVTSSIQIVFVFSGDMRLASYKVREVNTGP